MLEFLTEEELEKAKEENKKARQIMEESKSAKESLDEIKLEDSWVIIDGLPSLYKPYPKGIKFAYRKYIYDEILKINNPDIKLYQKYTLMLKGIKSVGPVSVNPLTLTLEDFLFISVLRKLESFGTSDFRIPYTCPHCHQELETYFKLSDIDFNTMQAPKVPAKVVFEQYPDEKFEFYPITVGDVIWLLTNDVAYSKDEDGEYILLDNGSYTYDDIAFLAKQCSNKEFNEAYKAIRNLCLDSDIQLINKLMNLLSHGVKPYSFTCQGKLDEEEKLPDDWDSYSEAKKEMYRKKQSLFRERCNQQVDLVIGGDTLILPFRKSTPTTSSGIFFD